MIIDMKYTALLLLLLFVGLQSRAQDESPRIIFGIKAGFGISYFSDDVVPFDQPNEKLGAFRRSERPALFPGITMDVELTSGFSFITELLYSPRGMEYSEKVPRVIIKERDGSEKSVYNNFDYNINYLELPLIINYNFSKKTAKTFWQAYAGIAPGVLISSKTKLDYYRETDTQQDTKSKLQDVRPFNHSFIAGIKSGDGLGTLYEGYIDLRASYTLSPVFKRALGDTGGNLNTRMYTFTLSLGIK
jgi:hypothetical protein